MLLSLSCISYHVIMCIAFAYVFIPCIQAFSPLSVLHSGASFSSGGHFYLPYAVGIKHFRIGPRLAKRPWFTTGRPPVKFRTIWTSLDTPTVTEGPRRPRVCCSPTPLQFGPKPTKTSSILLVVRSRPRGRKPHLIWTLLAPSTYKYVALPEKSAQIKP